MPVVIPIHIAAGLVGILAGAVALFAAKGARLHRKSGMVFVCAMTVLTVTATIIAIGKGQRLNGMQGVFTLYLVLTALWTVRPPARRARSFELGALVLVMILWPVYFALGATAAGSPKGMLEGYPPVLYYIFGTLALLAAIGDVRMLLARGIEGPRRIARHLWRMGIAMFIATGSFFLGQPQVFPKPIRIVPLLALPVVATLIVTLYWLWRVRVRRGYAALRLARGTVPE